MRKVLTAAAAAALLVSLATPAVASPNAEASPAPSSNAPSSNTPPSDASGDPTAIKTNERNGSFDMQSHRGGRGEWTEESLAAFANSLELGVTTLELDTHLTEDGKVIVWHDDTIQANKCTDTAPAVPGDAEFPYVGDRVAELSLAQVKTLNCGYTQLAGYPEQDVIEGNRIAELKDVYQLARDYDAGKVRFNVETKVEEGKAGGQGMVALTKAVVAEIYKAGMAERTTLQSFDWSSLNLTREIAPDLPLVALSSGDAWLEVGKPGAKPQSGRPRHRRLRRFTRQSGSRPGLRRRLPHLPLRHPRHDRRSPPAGPARYPVDGQHHRGHGTPDGPRRGRNHHRLPHAPAHPDGRARTQTAEGVQSHRLRPRRLGPHRPKARSTTAGLLQPQQARLLCRSACF
ncbi:glycerophosphodiester phosphodiesterase family protein [Arthrobacter sp. R1-13]